MSEQDDGTKLIRNPRLEEIKFPWDKQQSMLVYTNAVNGINCSLKDRFSHDKHIHAETLMSVIGCIAGFATKVATLARMEQEGIALKPPEINIVTLKSGKIISTLNVLIRT